MREEFVILSRVWILKKLTKVAFMDGAILGRGHCPASQILKKKKMLVYIYILTLVI